MSLHVRVYFDVGGGHTHLRVFVGQGPDYTHAKAGDLTFRNEEWAIIRPQLDRIGWEILCRAPEHPVAMTGGEQR